MDFNTVEAVVDMEDSGSEMSTRDLPRFGPSLLEVKTYSCLIILISQGVTSVLDESTDDLLLAKSWGDSCCDCGCLKLSLLLLSRDPCLALYTRPDQGFTAILCGLGK